MQKLEAENLDVLITVGDMAEAYLAAGNVAKALSQFYRAAVAIEKRKFVHKDAGEIVHRLCECYERMSQFDNAEVWRRKWLAVLKEKAGAESVAYAAQLAMLGWDLLQQKKWVEAETVLREVLAIQHKEEPDHWTTFETQSFLGSALLGQKKLADAQQLLLAGYKGMKDREARTPARARGRLTDTLEWLVQLYDAWGKKDEADKWRKELDATKGNAAK